MTKSQHENGGPGLGAVVRHSALYGLARGLPGVISFAALALYSRLLTPAEYGHYTLVLAGVGLAAAFCFFWLQIGLQRFAAAYRERRGVLLSTIAGGFLGLVGVTGLAGLGLAVAWPDPALRGMLGVGVLLLWGQAWFELNLTLANAELAPRRYGQLSLAKAAIALAVGGGLAAAGLGARGVLVGLLAGLVLPPLALAGRAWQGVGLAQFDRGIFRQLVGYGLPLTLTVLCQFGLTTSDRLILGWQRGPEAAGLFAVGTDLATMTLGLVMLVVHLAAYPLAVQTLEREGRAAAARQLEHNTTAILAVALPVTALLIVLAPALAQLILGAAFQETAARLIPWIAVAALLAGVKSFYLDLSFHLGRNTLGQITVSLLAVTVSVGLNLLLIPRLGLMGAAYTSLTALTLASLASWYLGRRHFPLPFPRRDAGKLLLATCGMGGFLWALAPARQPFMLLAHVLLGGLVYGGLAVWLNVGGSRARCLAGLAARRRGRDGKCGSGHGRDGG